MLKAACILSLLSLLATSVQAKDLDITQKGQTKRELTAPARSSFLNFLDQKASELKARAPQFHMSGDEKDIMTALSKSSISSTKAYLNREASCQFLAKIPSLTGDPAIALQLQELTRNGTVCIVRDLPVAEQTDWEFKMIHFLWNEKWIRDHDTSKSLFEYIVSRMGLAIKSEDLKILHLNEEVTEFDAYGYAHSASDLQTVKESVSLTEILRLGETYSPNDPRPAFQFGSQVKDIATKDPTGTAAFFITRPAIYLTNNWAPVDLPELLTHEFGHVVHGLHRKFLQNKNGSLFLTYDRYHEEGAAESFAWQSLCGLYPKLPELMFMHIEKLRIMAKFRPNDFHLVGAAAYAPDFHYQCGHPARFSEFVEAERLEDFKTPYQNLLAGEASEDQVLHFLWE
jgi:hypothetical protein